MTTSAISSGALNVIPEAQPRPPAGYSWLRVGPAEVVLPLTVSNKCGQAFRWYGTPVDTFVPPIEEAPVVRVKVEEDVKPDILTLTTSLKRKADLEDKLVVPQTPTVDTEYSVCLSDRVVLLRQDVERGFLYHRTLMPLACASAMPSPLQALPPSSFAHASEAQVEQTTRWLSDYLNLAVPLADLYVDWGNRDAVFARFATTFRGVRMLRQDPWECLCAFICSSNNNIARIGQMVQKLATHFSEPLMTIAYPLTQKTTRTTEDVKPIPTTITYYPFPPPSALAGPGVEAKLRELGFGYRAKYLAQTAQMLCSGEATQSCGAEDAASSTPSRGKAKGKGKKRSRVADELPASPAESIIFAETFNADGTPRKRTRAAQKIAAAASTTPSSVGLPTPASSPPALATLPVPDIVVRDDEVHAYLASLRKMSYEQARERLLQFQGVGPKVADCILLMSLDQPSSIPVDRHVFSFGARWYGLRSEKYEDVASALRELWGDWAGWAHSILFTADLRAFAKYEEQDGAKKEELEGGENAKIEAAVPLLTGSVGVEDGKVGRRR